MENDPYEYVSRREHFAAYLGIALATAAVLIAVIFIVIRIQQNKQMADFNARRDAWRAAAQTNVVNNPFPTTILDTNGDIPANSTAPQLGSFGLETNRN